jgi:hypothetical protein
MIPEWNNKAVFARKLSSGSLVPDEMIPKWNDEAIVARLTPEGFITPCGCVIPVLFPDQRIPGCIYRLVLQRLVHCGREDWQFLVLFENKELDVHCHVAMEELLDGDATWEEFWFYTHSRVSLLRVWGFWP